MGPKYRPTRIDQFKQLIKAAVRRRGCICIGYVVALLLFIYTIDVDKIPTYFSRGCGQQGADVSMIHSRDADVCMTYTVEPEVDSDWTTTAPPAQNAISYHYVVLPTANACDQKDLFLRIIVFTRAANFWRRVAIRQTWGDVSQYDVPVRLVFLIGMSPGDQYSLQAEIDRHGDILQGSFMDTYKNLTYKTSMGLRWVSESERYQRAKFVLKVDDDVFVNMFEVLEHLKAASSNRTHPVKNWLGCSVYYKSRPYRTRKNKYYISPQQYAEKIFPPFCSGVAYVMTQDVATGLYCASQTIPFLWLEDVYFTGLAARKLGLKHENIENRYILWGGGKTWQVTKTFSSVLFTHDIGVELQFAMWSFILKSVKKRSQARLISDNIHANASHRQQQ